MTNDDDNYGDEHDNWTIQRDQWERVVKEQCSCRPHIAAATSANSTKRRSSSPAIITTATSTTANVLSCYDGAIESMDMMRIISIREIESHGYEMKEKEQNKQ